MLCFSLLVSLVFTFGLSESKCSYILCLILPARAKMVGENLEDCSVAEVFRRRMSDRVNDTPKP